MDVIEEFFRRQPRSRQNHSHLYRLGPAAESGCPRAGPALLNYETNTEKLVQVVISGQLELRDRLLERRYKAFRSKSWRRWSCSR